MRNRAHEPYDEFSPIMPFGKHKGLPLDELPGSYLEWLFSRNLHDPLRSFVREEWFRRLGEEKATHQAYRDGQRQQAFPRRHAVPNVEDVDILITSGLHTLAKKFHPDIAGGDLGRMQSFNHVADWLRARVRELLP